MDDSACEEIAVCNVDELTNPGSKEFRIGDGDWPFKGFVVRRGDNIFAYQNYCMHVGHPLNWQADRFLTNDGQQIICASHGAVYEIETGVCVSGPCPGAKLRPVEVEIRDGVVIVTGPTRAP